MQKFDDAVQEARGALLARRAAPTKKDKIHATRNFFTFASQVLAEAEKSREPLPADISKAIGGLLEYLGCGIIPAPIKDIAGKGRRVSPAELRDKKLAVAFIREVKSGRINFDSENHTHNVSWVHDPVKIVIDEYGVAKTTVYGWMTEFRGVSTEDLCEGNADSVLVRMRDAARRFRLFGQTYGGVEKRARKQTGNEASPAGNRRRKKQRPKFRKMTAREVNLHRRLLRINSGFGRN